MTEALIAAAILILLTFLVLRGIRGHVRSGDGSGNEFGPGPDGGGD